ncbi:MAG: TVP38/TMEM64 family protein [Holophagales bacterium]|nr:TVP38/TMEM64 family protein [Holophagales bacterium]MYD21449.1 TVP38/TMEM64 family protein [Holophagales bacterium]MYI32703.1 TVP38/TMEM64 family protein [Holophagales bacterium]
MNEAPGTAGAKSSKAGLAFRAAAVVVLIAALLLFGRRVAGYLPEFGAWVDSLGVWGPIVFVLGYTVATVAFIPGSLLTLAGGAIFGLAEGTALVFVGASLGATAAFLASRYLVRGAIEKRVAAEPRFAAIDRAVGREGFKIVLLLRLTPIVPFVLLNYALGLTRVSLGDYVRAFIGMFPATLLYVYYGKVIGDVAEIAAGTGDERDWGTWVVTGVGLLATIAVIALVTRIARRALREEVGE